MLNIFADRRGCYPTLLDEASPRTTRPKSCTFC